MTLCQLTSLFSVRRQSYDTLSIDFSLFSVDDVGVMKLCRLTPPPIGVVTLLNDLFVFSVRRRGYVTLSNDLLVFSVRRRDYVTLLNDLLVLYGVMSLC